MANTASFNGSDIINSTSFIAFGCQHGVMDYQECKDSNGQAYTMLVFTEPATDKETYVSISSKIADKVDDDFIAKNVENLQVVELSVDDALRAEREANGRQAESYMLCMKGQGTRKRSVVDFRALAGLK